MLHELDRTFVSVRVIANEGYDRTMKEEVGAHLHDRWLITDVVTALLRDIPMKRGGTKVIVMWSLQNEDPDKTASGTQDHELYRGTDISELADYIAGKMVGEINNQVSEKMKEYAKRKIGDLLSEVFGDDDEDAVATRAAVEELLNAL